MARHGFIAMVLTASAFVPSIVHAQEAPRTGVRSVMTASILPTELAMAARAAARSDARVYRAAEERQVRPKVAPIQIAMADTRAPFSGR